VVGDASVDATNPRDGSSDARDTGLDDGFAPDGVGPGPDGATDGSPADATSMDATSTDATSMDAMSTDATPTDSGPALQDSAADVAEVGPLCMTPLVDCGGMCVDTTSDPSNCGQCSNVCPSQICTNGMCQGSTAGGIVFIGHDYLNTPTGTAQARVLSNAVLIPQNNPLQVLSYEHYATAAAVTRVKAIVDSFAAQEGRGLTITSTSVDSDIPTSLVFSSFQVLIVQDQPTAPSGALATLGASWATTLTTFTQAGGIVVVLDGGTGVGQMPDFSTATTLLSVTAQAPIATGTRLFDVAPGDVVGVGVVSPYGAGQNSVSITTEASAGNVVYVIDLPSDAGSALPVVVHKVF
jgi:hypothetical protein